MMDDGRIEVGTCEHQETAAQIKATIKKGMRNLHRLTTFMPTLQF